MTCESTLEITHLIFLFKNVTTWRQMLSIFCLIFKLFQISSNPFLAANPNQNEKKIGPPSSVCHGLPENAFQVNQLYNVTWSNDYNQLHDNLYKIKFVLGSWKLWFSNINEIFLLRNQNFGSFWPIIDFELKRKRPRAEPSWKSFSSSSGSSQLGSDSSLIHIVCIAFLFFLPIYSWGTLIKGGHYSRGDII